MDGKYVPEDDFDSDIEIEQEEVNQNLNDFDDDIEINNESSQLASAPGKNLILMIVLGGATIIFLYNIVFSETPEEVEVRKTQEIIATQPVQDAVKPTEEPVDDLDVSGTVSEPEPPAYEDLPALPELEEIEVIPQRDLNVADQFTPAPIAPLNPPANNNASFVPEPTPTPPTPPTNTQQQQPAPLAPSVPEGPSPEELAAIRYSKMRQGMIVMNNGGTPANPVGADGIALGTSGISGLNNTEAETTDATFIGDTDYIIAQGKMISAVLETAINTDLEGMLRAVVSRDVYAESGRNILIPKGSRLIGSYNSSIDRGQTRVVVFWDRVIRPDGIDVALESPGTDQLGRSGLTGFVDNKYFDIISNAFLLSAITVGGAIFIDKVEGSSSTSSSTTTGNDGSTTSTSTGTPTDAAVLSGIDEVADVIGDITSGMLNDQPTIIVQQGERLKVFVNRDIHFPKSAAGGSVKFIN